MANGLDVNVCLLGVGNLGASILSSLLVNFADDSSKSLLYACVRSEESVLRLSERFKVYQSRLRILQGLNVTGVSHCDVIILGPDPADVETLLREPGLATALKGKLLISIVAGWTRESLESTLYETPTTAENQQDRAWIVRTLPNIAANVSQSMTAIEKPEHPLPAGKLELVKLIFNAIGKTVEVAPSQMPIATAVGGSTPAFFAIICDALIDASVATGLSRQDSQMMIYQAMQGTASLLQSGISPGQLKEIGTSPAGCTIGGVMVLEESAVRGHVGRALRESVAIAHRMGSTQSANTQSKAGDAGT